MSAVVLGRTDWSRSTDSDGHREYKLKCLVQTTSPSDGPAIVSIAYGLPTVGAPWQFGNDSDPWAFCLPSLSINPVVSKEPNVYWTTEQTFSTKPIRRCQDSQVGNPLSEPQKVSGTFAVYTKEAEKDRLGKLILSSSHERIKGIEKKDVRPTVTIEQNTPALQLDSLSGAINKLNDGNLWGLTKRKVMLTNITWRRNVYGTCNYYYTRTLEFEVRFDGFDEKEVAQVGYKCRKGTWNNVTHVWVPSALSAADPTNFDWYKEEWSQRPTPTRILLTANGDPLTDPTNPVFHAAIELYGEYNFLTLGIPTWL